ncbi:SDR family NAD(P)-dependent oxidoreductase [Maribius pontilimi]|uniref:SDR family NAD(P)-dependent oxidoreductase n=1 Tax=Palleronia pontilimi TaxID=1964209 RepID=A0A934MEH7_9RHOB|nr:SDR family NAD(P)-dependent oxidoreductase [Palleronia pontilimi]MBJ3763456.1 SDR family NAD(P)-dependent oxidoreductase [Palleronia pontilimi]
MHALITGANRGIGAAMADALGARGDTVTRTSRAGGDGYLTLDVADSSSVRAMADTLGDAPLDLLVCNAGIYADKDESLETGYPSEMWAQEFATNVTGVFLCIQALLPNLKAAGGKIAIISSQLGSSEIASGGGLIYCASKAAAINLGRNLAVDLKPAGVAVGIYHPGWVQTEMGGTSAAITPQRSAKGLIDRFDALSIDNTGHFKTFDGQDHPF